MQTLTNRPNGLRSPAFLPDENLPVTEGAGTMRIVRLAGVVSAPNRFRFYARSWGRAKAAQAS